MTTDRDIVIISTQGCRRSRAMLAYLERQGIPFTHITAESAEGQDLIDQYRLRASPGILVDGVSVSPFDLLIPPTCEVDEEAARRAFGPVTGQRTSMETDGQGTRS
jgi:glutaredoxin